MTQDTPALPDIDTRIRRARQAMDQARIEAQEAAQRQRAQEDYYRELLLEKGEERFGTPVQLTAAAFPEEFQVSVCVFATARGTDPGDAAHRVEMTIREAITGNRIGALPHRLPLPHRGSNVEGAHVEVVGVLDASTAAMNGYLRLSPTKRAWNERGML